MDVPSSWMQVAGTVAVLTLLEAVLSADNAVAIAALVRDLDSERSGSGR